MQSVNISLQIKAISKFFQRKKIYDRFSHNFQIGCNAIKGPNGIGKTTLLKIISGAQRPNNGTVLINDIDLISKPTQAKQYLAYVPDKLNFYPYITGTEFLHLIMQVRKIKETSNIEAIITRFKIAQFLDTQLGEMSLGTQKKFALTAAFISRADILILDEPTHALDDNSTEVLFDFLQSIKDKKIIVFSCHDNRFIQSLNSKELTLVGLPNKIFV